MSEADRARLRAKKEENKGRASLAGIDSYGWAAALDHAKELEADDTLPRVELNGRGALSYNFSTDGTSQIVDGFTVWRRRPDNPDKVTANWVRLRYTRSGQENDLVLMFSSKLVAYDSYTPIKGTEKRTTRVFNLSVVVAVFQFLWPKETSRPGEEPEWVTRLRRYAVGYTDLFVNHNEVNKE
jgi:hypothetical protein